MCVWGQLLWLSIDSMRLIRVKGHDLKSFVVNFNIDVRCQFWCCVTLLLGHYYMGKWCCCLWLLLACQPYCMYSDVVVGWPIVFKCYAATRRRGVGYVASSMLGAECGSLVGSEFLIFSSTKISYSSQTRLCGEKSYKMKQRPEIYSSITHVHFKFI